MTWSATSGQLTLYASGTANNSTVSGGAADVHAGVSVQMTSLTLGDPAPFAADLNLLQRARRPRRRRTSTRTSTADSCCCARSSMTARATRRTPPSTTRRTRQTQRRRAASTDTCLRTRRRHFARRRRGCRRRCRCRSTTTSQEDLSLTVDSDVFDVCKNATASDLRWQQWRPWQ